MSFQMVLLLHHTKSLESTRFGTMSFQMVLLLSPNGQLTVRGAIDEVYEKIGLRLTFDDPFDPVEMVDKKEQDK